MYLRLKIIAVSLLTSLISHLVSGQEITDGFIILPNGDYQYGTVKFDPSLNKYEECQFAADGKKEYTRFTPDQISGYGVINGIHYITREILTGETLQKHFLKKEIDELVRFYSYNNNRYFIEKDDFKELKQDDYEAILSEALKSCKNILASIKKVNFDLQGLRSIFLKYQLCTDPASATVPSVRLQFDVLAGLEFNNSTLSGNPTLNQNKSKLTDKTLLSAGVNTIISFKKSRHLLFAAGAYYYQQNFYAIDPSITVSYSSTDKINFNYHEILIPVSLHYSFFKKEKNIMPYLKAGISIPLTIKSSLVWESEKEYASTVFFERYPLPQKFKQDLQPTISIGTTFTVLRDIRNVLEVSYIKGGGKLKDNTSTVSVTGNRLVVLMGFRF